MSPRAFTSCLVIFLVSLAPKVLGNGEPQVKYLDAEVMTWDDSRIVVRGAMEISAAPHQWLGVYFPVYLNESTPLTVRGAGQDAAFMKFWANLFTPDGPARWTECRAEIPLAELAGATNLPKGQRSILWVTCALWDHSLQRYLGNSWSIRTPLFVTTDAAGKITSLATFHTDPFMSVQDYQSPVIHPDFGWPLAGSEEWDRSQERIRERPLEGLRNLVLKPAVKCYSVRGIREETYHVLVLGREQGTLEGRYRGFFFGPVDSPDKARELVELGYPGAAVIEDRRQYQALVDALRALGWKEPQSIRVPGPAFIGETVEAEPGFGYRVRILMADNFSGEAWDVPQHVWLREIHVDSAGRLGIRQVVCIEGAYPEGSQPAGWQQPVPAGQGRYAEVLKKALQGVRVIPSHVRPSDPRLSADRTS